jgi:hypothetical protein
MKREAWTASLRLFEITCELPPALPYKPGHIALMTGTNALEIELCEKKVSVSKFNLGLSSINGFSL